MPNPSSRKSDDILRILIPMNSMINPQREITFNFNTLWIRFISDSICFAVFLSSSRTLFSLLNTHLKFEDGGFSHSSCVCLDFYLIWGQHSSTMMHYGGCWRRWKLWVVDEFQFQSSSSGRRRKKNSVMWKEEKGKQFSEWFSFINNFSVLLFVS